MYILKYRWICLSLMLLCLNSCKSSYITKSLEDNFYKNQFTGLLIYNPKSNDTVYKYNADKYFTPASNTKIFTLYTALKMLPERVPAFKYSIENDTISILGTGNPTFLHPFFNDSTALKIAKPYKKVNLILGNLLDDKFGPGWAWEDYDTYFSPEKSSFPVYGNVVTINNRDSLQCVPKVLQSQIQVSESKKRRDFNSNTFYFNPKRKDTIEVPLVINQALTKQLWEDILPKKVSNTQYSGNKFNHIAYGIESDSLYKRMMVVSDNFLAEHMLLLASSTISDTLSSERVRESILNHQLKDLKQKPRWVDGSGLSRYNLFTPTSFVQVLTKLYNEIPNERLYNFFPSGGKSGTLKNYYSGTSRPYIYAKSGTVGNNYSLSGYLITNSGKTLIFSFMNNHYRQSTVAVKKRMQLIFEWLRDNY